MGKHRKPPEGVPGPDERNYPIGYMKPPTHSQFTKGKSGNPSGRPKQVTNMKKELEKALAKRVVVKTPDGPEDIDMLTLLVRSLINSAVKGAVGSQKLLASLIQQYEIGASARSDELSAEDEADFNHLRDILKGGG